MQTAAACVDSAVRPDFTRTCGQAGRTEIRFDADAELVQLLGRKQLLHAFKQLALLPADMVREQGSEGNQTSSIHGPAGGAVDGGAQFHVLAAELAYERSQIRKPFGGGEKNTFFGIKVEADLLVEEADDLLLPTANVVGGGTTPTFDADTKGQGVLMLAGERDEGRVAKHDNILTPLYENTLAG